MHLIFMGFINDLSSNAWWRYDEFSFFSFPDQAPPYKGIGGQKSCYFFLRGARIMPFLVEVLSSSDEVVQRDVEGRICMPFS